MLARPGPVGLAWEECWVVHDWLPAHGAIMVPAGWPRRLDWDARHAADPLTHTDQPKGLYATKRGERSRSLAVR